MKYLLCLLLCLCQAWAEDTVVSNRQGKFFIVASTTTTTTTTVTTSSLCYTSANAITTACPQGRKKRGIFNDPISGETELLALAPSRTSGGGRKTPLAIESGNQEMSDNRKGKFLLSWLTTTTTSTSTSSSYSATLTFSVACTPSTWPVYTYSLCG